MPNELILGVPAPANARQNKLLPKPPVWRVQLWTGGQTGVDRAAMDVALRRGEQPRGFLPINRWSEDGEVCANTYSAMHSPEEGFEDDLEQSRDRRTRLNVEETDATLVLTWGNKLGGVRSLKFAHERRVKNSSPRPPIQRVDLERVNAETRRAETQKVRRWVQQQGIHRLLIDGPSESEAPGVYAAATSFLLALFPAVDLSKATPPAMCRPADPQPEPLRPRRWWTRKRRFESLGYTFVSLVLFFGLVATVSPIYVWFEYPEHRFGYYPSQVQTGSQVANSQAATLLAVFAAGLSVLAVAGLGFAVNHIEGRRVRAKNLNDLAAKFDSAEFTQYRVDAWKYAVETIDRPWDPWLYEPEDPARNAVFALIAFYRLVAQSIEDRSVDADSAVSYFGAAFVWWYVHLYRKNCGSGVKDTDICAIHNYDGQGAYGMKLDRLYLTCVRHPELGPSFLDSAFGDLGRNQQQSRRL